MPPEEGDKDGEIAATHDSAGTSLLVRGVDKPDPSGDAPEEVAIEGRHPLSRSITAGRRRREPMQGQGHEERPPALWEWVVKVGLIRVLEGDVMEVPRGGEYYPPTVLQRLFDH